MSDRYQQLFLEAGALSNNGRYTDAGRAILNGLNITPNQAGALNAKARKLAYLAARYFAKSDDVGPAVELYIALGENNKAADCLEKNGDILTAQKLREGRLGQVTSLSGGRRGATGGAAVTRFTGERFEKEGKLDLAVKAYLQVRAYGDAGRVLKAQGRVQEAAGVYVEGGRAFEAGICYLELGDAKKAMDNLVRVPVNHPQYRFAALKVVALGVQLQQMTFPMDTFLAEFIRTAPMDTHELDALYQLGRLYESQALTENAKEVLIKVLKTDSGYRDTTARLERLQQFSKPSAAVYEKIQNDEARFRSEKRRINPSVILNSSLRSSSDEHLPELPPLPDLPDLSPLGALGRERPSLPAEKANFSGTIAAIRAMNPAQTGGQRHGEQAPVSEAPGDDKGFVVGNLIARRYLLQQEIGRGGMAVVFRAEDRELEEKIALKVFLTAIDDPDAIRNSEARFKQELKLSRRLVHKNIIRLYDIGMHSGHRYISMELLDGRDLDQWLIALNGPMDFVKGIYLMIQACAGLNAAHEQGVVHRDIKPENLFVTREGVLKVMDFGIAKNTVKPGMTMEGTFAGTPHYIAPEQISSFSRVTPAADLYSLGVVMYRMFTGTLPFDNEDLSRLLMMQMTNPPTPPTEINPEIPKDLEQIILNLMSKSPDDRLKDARDTAAYLKQVYLRLTASASR